MHILVIEDDISLQQQLKVRLEEKKYIVDVASDGAEGLYLGIEYPVDIAIIDLGLPKLSGLNVIQQLRAANKRFPILVLTARSQWSDKVKALESGADDYLVKPFHMEELLARISALMRRSGGWASPVLESGPICLDTRTQVVSVNATSIELTAFEYKVLEYLMLHPGEIISKATLTEHLYEQDFDKDSNVIEVFVARLRKKLDPDNTYQPIETLRGRGYRFIFIEPSNKSPDA